MTLHFTPSRSLDGASPLGNSYLSLWASCPRAWYNTYYRREEFADRESTGIEPQWRKPSLSFGTITHRGLEALYLSGCRDGEDTGEWNIEAAIEAARLEHLKGADRYESPDQSEQDWLEIQGLLRRYYDRFGPKGASPDWPNIRVLCDTEGKPIVERELWTPLGDSGRFYSVRVDALISHYGIIQEFQHKTSAPGMWLNNRLKAIHTDSQMTGTCYVIAKEFPELDNDGIYTNILIKGTGKDSLARVAAREKTTRTPEDLETFEKSSLAILGQIDTMTSCFETMVSAGTPTSEAVNRCFPDHGQRTGHCQAYGGCQFLPLCHRKGAEVDELRMFKPRVLDIETQPELSSESSY